MSRHFVTARTLAGLLPFAWLLPLACVDDGEAARTTAEPPPVETQDGEAPRDAAPEVKDARSPVDASPCSAGGFCFEDLPVRTPLRVIAATSIDDAWAIGESVILRWDGTAWQRAYEPARSITFDAIWAPKRDDVWAMGRDEAWSAVFVRYARTDAGDVFREISTEEKMFSLVDTWVTPSSDAFWIASGDATALRFHEENGALTVDRFTPRAGASDTRLYSWSSLWGFDGDDVFVGGTACARDPIFGFCDSSVPMRTALAHFDGTSFSVALLDGEGVLAMFGTPPGRPRHLWLTTARGQSKMTELVRVSDDHTTGPPLYRRSLAKNTERVVGAASERDMAWISSGLLLWRWTGSELVTIPTARHGVPAGTIHALWAGGEDEAWIVGAALPEPGLSPSGFAARRRTGGGEP